MQKRRIEILTRRDNPQIKSQEKNDCLEKDDEEDYNFGEIDTNVYQHDGSCAKNNEHTIKKVMGFKEADKVR